MADVQQGNIGKMRRRQILLHVSLAVFATLTLRSGTTADLAMAGQAGPPTMIRVGMFPKPFSTTRFESFRVGFEPQETVEDLKKAVHVKTKIPVESIDVYCGYDLLEKEGVTIQAVAEREIKRRGRPESTGGLPVLLFKDQRQEATESLDLKRYQQKAGEPFDWALYCYDRDSQAEQAKWDQKKWPARGESLKTK